MAGTATTEGLFAGFDVGTQGLKGLVIDLAERRVVARASASYGLIQGLGPGAAEQHPDTWIAALSEVARALFTGQGVEPRRLRGIGISGQQHGLVVVDAAGRPLRAAKLWCDTETADEARELSERLGRPIPAGFTAPKVLWLARREPEVWARTRRVLLPHDYVNFVLGGEAWCESGDASGTGWFDVRARAIDAAACRAIDPALLERLPPTCAADAIPARLTAAGARLLSLPPECVGVALSAGAGDNMASAIGAGATREGVAVVSLGTSATVFAHSRRPVIDPSGGIASFCDSTGGWLPLLCLMNATGALEEVRAAFGRTHAELERLAAALPMDVAEDAARDLSGDVGGGGPLCVPFFVGERVPDLPRARAALVGLGPGSLAPGRLYRTVLEGIVLNLAEGVERLRGLGVPCRELLAVGGGARNRLWLELLAAATEAQVTPLAEPESAALGAALQAAWAVESAASPGRGCDAVAAGWAERGGDAARPDPAIARNMAAKAVRFRELSRGLFGPGAARPTR